MYLFLSVALLIIVATVLGIRFSNIFRWALIVGWPLLCLVKVWLHERLLLWLRPTFRPPILSEESRLTAAVDEVLIRAGSRLRPRLLIDGDTPGHNRSAGYRTIIIHSGCLVWASDGELRAIVAFHLTQLRDNAAVTEEITQVASPMAIVFRMACRVIKRVFRIFWLFGIFLAVLAFLVLPVLLPFYLLEMLFRLLRRGLGQWQVLRTDACVFQLGFGDAWRDWLERSALGMNARRIRRLEKMAGLRG